MSAQCCECTVCRMKVLTYDTRHTGGAVKRTERHTKAKADTDLVSPSASGGLETSEAYSNLACIVGAPYPLHP